MNVQSFLKHHQLTENPFTAEEARLDPVFAKLGDANPQHPDFAKILGRIDNPATAVVFGEKGSGKTAIRIDIEEHVQKHNEDHPDRRVLTVAYDDLNPVLDQLQRAKRQDASKMLDNLRLEDHQDAMLSLAVTKVVDAILGGAGTPEVPMPDKLAKVLKKLPKEKRRDLAVLAMLYDNPGSGDPVERHAELSKKLRLGSGLPLAFWLWVGVVGAVMAAGFGTAWFAMGEGVPWWVIPGVILGGAMAIGGFFMWFAGSFALWKQARKVLKEMPAVHRSAEQLKAMLANTAGRTLTGQPLPEPHTDKDGPRDNRYQLTRRFVSVLKSLGYCGVMFLVDRMDEPTIVQSDPQKMRAIVWPMFDNKFLKQDDVGVKLLLPIELSYLLDKESREFYERARLDKQNKIDRLTWSGATLYDLCTSRLNIVRPMNAEKMSLTDLFTEDVDRSMLIDALDQMHQPRDAFKFMYGVIQEHCRLMPEESAEFQIARLTLDNVRRNQSQRVQELYRGLTAG
ncbi:MAG: hypothetical protein AAF663_03440 [Planctomycetota bacterium]